MKRHLSFFVCLVFCTVFLRAEAFSPLFLAVLNNDLESVKQILKDSPGALDERIEDYEEIECNFGYSVSVQGATPLHFALVKQNVKMVSLLVEKGADLTIADEDGWDATLYAVSYSSIPCLEILLAKDPGILTRRKYAYDSTPLHWAARYNSVDMVWYLVETCGMDVNARDEDDETPLDYTSFRSDNDPSIAEYLVSAGANDDKSIFTVFQNAVFYGIYEQVTEILAKNPGLLDKTVDAYSYITSVSGEHVGVEGAVPLYLALVKQDEKMVSLLLDAGADFLVSDHDGWDGIMYAAAYSSVPCIKMLLEKNPKLLTRRRYVYDTTPLHWAARYNNVEMIRFLVETAGMDVNEPDEDGETSLDYADESENSDVIKYIESKGGYRVEDVSFSPLHKAVLNNNYEEAKLLLEKEPGLLDKPAGYSFYSLQDDVEISTKGATAIHLALLTKNEKLVKLLVDKGADLRLADKSDCDSIIYAAAYSSVPCIKILLEKNPKLLTSRRYIYDTTPLHWAARYNNVEMVRFLVETAGMNVNEPDEDGDTPLDYAESRDDESYEVIGFLRKAGAVSNND